MRLTKRVHVLLVLGYENGLGKPMDLRRVGNEQEILK